MVLRGMSASTQRTIWAWVDWMTKVLGDVKDQVSPMMVAVLQDDFSVAVILEAMAGWLEALVVEKSTGELGIKMSLKEAASQPFSEVFSAIGATFDMRLGYVMVRPKDAVIRKLRGVVEGWGMDEMVRWEFDKVERLAGLIAYFVAFLDSREARQARSRVMGQLVVQLGVPAGIRFMRKQVRQGVVNILDVCERMEFGGMVRGAKWEHACLGFCAADARASVHWMLTG